MVNVILCFLPFVLLAHDGIISNLYVPGDRSFNSSGEVPEKLYTHVFKISVVFHVLAYMGVSFCH